MVSRAGSGCSRARRGLGSSPAADARWRSRRAATKRRLRGARRRTWPAHTRASARLFRLPRFVRSIGLRPCLAVARARSPRGRLQCSRRYASRARSCAQRRPRGPLALGRDAAHASFALASARSQRRRRRRRQSPRLRRWCLECGASPPHVRAQPTPSHAPDAFGDGHQATPCIRLSPFPANASR